MTIQRITPEELWSRQQISSLDVDYNLWNKKRTSIQAFSQMSQSCIFTVDVFKERYDFASDRFTDLFGYNSKQIKTIRKQGNLLEERIHPDDRTQLLAFQIEHGLFIYSLPQEERNDYQQVFQIRMQNVRQQYVNVISRHQVVQKDRKGKAWIIMGTMELSPNQTPSEKILRTVINRKTGEIIPSATLPVEEQLTRREKEILLLIRQGLLSKEIAYKLHLSIYTVNNHRKHILSKLQAGNAIEAINRAEDYGLLY
ncbi:MAG: LuxR C-terminal-related transcriptional regulator [Odoribacter splanchnicus]